MRHKLDGRAEITKAGAVTLKHSSLDNGSALWGFAFQGAKVGTDFAVKAGS